MLTESTYPRLADLHTDALALNWQRRARLLQSPVKNFDDLLRWDLRLASHVQALWRLGSTGRARISSSLDDPLTRGDFFALACYAMNNDDHELIEATYALACSMPHLQPPLLAAIEWQGDNPSLDKWIDTLPYELHLHALASSLCNVRLDPQKREAIVSRLHQSNAPPEQTVAGLYLMRSLGDHNIVRGLDPLLAHDSPDVRLSAAQTILVFSRPEYTGAAVETLNHLISITTSPEIQASALRILALHAPAHAVSALTSPINQATVELRRLRIMAHGWTGRINAITLLTEQLADPADARQAAAAITLITGSEPHRDGWSAPTPSTQREAPDSKTDTLAKSDPDRELPWPSHEGFVDWWARHRARFSPNETYLYGLPVAPVTLVRILRHGPLAGRTLAAERLQRLTNRPLFQTHLPAMRQQKLFSTLPQDTQRD